MPSCAVDFVVTAKTSRSMDNNPPPKNKWLSQQIGKKHKRNRKRQKRDKSKTREKFLKPYTDFNLKKPKETYLSTYASFSPPKQPINNWRDYLPKDETSQIFEEYTNFKESWYRHIDKEQTARIEIEASITYTVKPIANSNSILYGAQFFHRKKAI